MSEFRLSPEAEAELDGIWIRIARESGSIDIATRVVEKITERFWLLARNPYLGRQSDEDLLPGLRLARREKSRPAALPGSVGRCVPTCQYKMWKRFGSGYHRPW